MLRTQYPQNSGNTAHLEYKFVNYVQGTFWTLRWMHFSMDFWLLTFHKENDKSSWLHDWLGAVAHCCCPALWENVILHIARPEKDWNSKLKVCLLLNAYYFPTIIKKKNCKSNQCKLGTSCVIPDNMRGPEWISFKLLKLDWYFSKVQKKFHLQK